MGQFDERYIKVMEMQKNISTMSLSELKEFYTFVSEVHDEYENFQLVVKRNANSLYGVCASEYFSLHDTDLAEDIPVTGRHFAILIDRAINNFFVNWANDENNLKKIQEFYPDIKSINNFIDYKPDTKDDLCCYGDTDSRYIRLDMIYELLLNKKLPEDNIELAEFSVFLAENFINKIIADAINEDCEKRNARKGFLKMAHEVTTRKSIFLKKKKYIMSPFWSDGKLGKIKLKFKGVELKKGSMSEKAKKILSKLINKYILENFTNEEIRLELLKIIKYIKLKKDKELIYQISSVSGLSDIVKNEQGIWVSKSGKTHIQMQIALSWNNFIEKNKLTEIYRPAFEGQKMQYYYCNPDSGYKVIGIPDDYEINDIKELPEPDWNKMIIQTLVKPLCRYIINKEEIDDKDIEAFLLGVKIWNFSKK